MSTITSVNGITFGDGTTQNTAVTSAATGANITTIYTTPGPTAWTKPATLKYVKVTVLGGGGGGSAGDSSSGAGGGGGAGGYGYFPAPTIPGPLTITVGAGGGGATRSYGQQGTTAGTSGGTTSFGSLISATGGGGGGNDTPSGVAGGSAGTITQGPTVIGGSGYAAAPVPPSTSITPAYAGGSFQYWGNGGANNIIYQGGSTPAAAQPGQGYGAGGGAAKTTGSGSPLNAIAGNGSGGFVIVEEFY
jgi:hypothetical protein